MLLQRSSLFNSKKLSVFSAILDFSVAVCYMYVVALPALGLA